LTWQTPERQYFEADPEARRRWQEETLPKIRETLQETDTVARLVQSPALPLRIR
jgi:hypothetical protein